MSTANTTITDSAEAHVIPTVSIAALTFSGGDQIELAANDKVLIVGSNNSGKSRSIREIIANCELTAGHQFAVVRQVLLDKRGSLEDFQRFIERTGKLTPGSDMYQIRDWQFNRWSVPQWAETMLGGGIAGGFIKNLDASSRLAICNLQDSIAVDEPATCPQHVLYADDQLMDRVSELFKQAFGQELVLNIRGGRKIQIHVGSKPSGPAFADTGTEAYAKAVGALPALHEQGDGIRSFAGILFHTIASSRSITFIDEPEAFLHPPQMRKLGEILATSVSGQLLAATHSSDILRGFLEGGRGKVRILRISREGSVNHVYEASPESIESLYSTPALRYSAALEAIFHEQAIICEDDSDCRLLNSMADHLESVSGKSWPDTAYVPTGGKSGIARVANALRAVGVRVKAVYDFDLVSDQSELKRAVTAFGGQWEAIYIHWARIDAAVRSISPPSNARIKESIVEILNNSDDQTLPKKEVIEAFRQKSQWNSVKTHGQDGLPRGEIRRDAEAMLALLSEIGIYLIPSGEAESFCPSIGGHGPSFVTKLLSDIHAGDIRLQGLRDFTQRVHLGPAAAVKTAGTVAERLERMQQ